MQEISLDVGRSLVSVGVKLKGELNKPRVRVDPMIQSIRHGEPLYSCVVSVERLTGRPDEELTAFGITEEEARLQAEELLREQYSCSEEQIKSILQQAQVEPLSPWCGVQSDDAMD